MDSPTFSASLGVVVNEAGHFTVPVKLISVTSVLSNKYVTLGCAYALLAFYNGKWTFVEEKSY